MKQSIYDAGEERDSVQQVAWQLLILVDMEKERLKHHLQAQTYMIKKKNCPGNQRESLSAWNMALTFSSKDLVQEKLNLVLVEYNPNEISIRRVLLFYVIKTVTAV